MSLGVIILLIVLWFRLQPELYSLLMIVLCELKCGRGGRGDSCLSFEMFTVNLGWQNSFYYKNMLETKGKRQVLGDERTG